MSFTPRHYGAQIAGFAGQIGTQCAIIARDSTDPLDAEARGRVGTACEALHALFSRVRALQPPPDYHAAHATFCAALDRYDEAAQYRLAGASLMDQGETERGFAAWRRALPLEVEANDGVRRAAQQIRSG